MELVYGEEREFTEGELEELFLSVDWSSGKYPALLARAMRGYSYVCSARENGRLVGLAAAMDDGAMVAYVHYLLVLPEYQGRGVGKELLSRLKGHYSNFLKIVLVASEGKRDFYAKYGFKDAKGTPMNLTEMDD